MKSKIRQVCNAYWLRPETAMWRAKDLLLLEKTKFKSPSLDLGCGDGTFMFINQGGEFKASHDVFKETGNLLNFHNNEDIYNHYTQDYFPAIKQPVKKKISRGLDHKLSLLLKARKISVYEKLKWGDANKELDYSPKSFKTIFSNTLYWLDDVDAVLEGFCRILKENGRVYLFVPGEEFKKSQAFYSMQSPKWVRVINRAKYGNNQHCFNSKAWRELFERHGFEVRKELPYLGNRFVQFWDFGFRPFSPELIKMQKILSWKEAMDIKESWVDTLEEIASSYIREGIDQGEKCFYFYELGLK